MYTEYLSDLQEGTETTSFGSEFNYSCNIPLPHPPILYLTIDNYAGEIYAGATYLHKWCA